MKTRIITSLAGGPLMLGLLFWPGGWPWFALVTVVMAVAIYEFTSELWAKGIYVHWMALVAFGALAMLAVAPTRSGYLCCYVRQGIAWLQATGGPGWLAVLALILLAGDLFWKRRSPLKNLGATFVGAVWLTGFLPFLIRIRGIGSTGSLWLTGVAGKPPFGAQEGAWLVLTVLLSIWAGDTGAYFAGRAFGKRKMAPAISPNKTWEGAFGGFVASGLMGCAALWPVLPYAGVGIAFGMLVGGVGQIGDLVESAIKREIGIKDFGNLLPGHGGVLDRFDSLLYAGPVAYVFLIWLHHMAR